MYPTRSRPRQWSLHRCTRRSGAIPARPARAGLGHADAFQQLRAGLLCSDARNYRRARRRCQTRRQNQRGRSSHSCLTTVRWLVGVGAGRACFSWDWLAAADAAAAGCDPLRAVRGVSVPWPEPNAAVDAGYAVGLAAIASPDLIGGATHTGRHRSASRLSGACASSSELPIPRGRQGAKSQTEPEHIGQRSGALVLLAP